MKRSSFIILFLITNITFIIAHIDKSNRFIETYYKKQRHEKEKKQLEKKLQDHMQQLQEMKRLSNIKKFAQKSLRMENVDLNRVKKITTNG